MSGGDKVPQAAYMAYELYENGNSNPPAFDTLSTEQQEVWINVGAAVIAAYNGE